MNIVASFADGAALPLGPALSMHLQRSEDAPADSLSLLLPHPGPCGELLGIQIQENGILLFDGIVDEQCASLSSSGCVLRLEARSKAALLLDNEALPQEYERPSLPMLFRRHAQPYGFGRAMGNEKAFPGSLTVSKGMSEWSVLEEFCRTFLHTRLFVDLQGNLDATGSRPAGMLAFGQGAGKIPYLSLEEQRLPCKRISEVLVRPSRQGGYTVRVTDPQAIAFGIRRRRYCNAPPGSGKPASYGGQRIAQARRKGYRVELLCPGRVEAPCGFPPVYRASRTHCW